MARLREKQSEPKTEQGSENRARAQREFIAKAHRKRIFIFLNDDGTPDLSKLTDQQKELLGLNSDAKAKKPGSEGEQAPPVAFPPQMAGMMLQVLISIETAVVAPRMDLEADAVRLALTPIPPIAQGIQELAAQVMNKYAGALGAYAEEIALVSLIVTWQASAFGELRQLKAEAQKKLDRRPKPPDVHETIEMKPFMMPTPPKAPAAAKHVNGTPEPTAPATAAATGDNPFFDANEPSGM